MGAKCFYIHKSHYWGLFEDKIEDLHLGIKIQEQGIKAPPDKTSGSNKKVAIIDDFTTKSVFVDLDAKPDITHGEVIKRFIQEGLPQAQIDCFEVKSEEGNDAFLKSANASLDSIIKKIDDGEKYDALNISFSATTYYSTISKQTGEEITPQNIAQKKDSIRKWMEGEKTDQELIQIKEIMKKLDAISSKGVPVYICADQGKHQKIKRFQVFNLLNLSNNVKAVGALNKKGGKSRYSADNSLITDWSQGEFKIQKKTDSNGKTGFDYTGDGTIDIYEGQTTSYSKKVNPYGLLGTSFSTPKALARDLSAGNIF